MRARPLAPLAEIEPLLRGVARSFYLSIRLLPRPLRRPIGVAYLLARAADTVADTPGRPIEERQRQLAWLAAAFERVPQGVPGEQIGASLGSGWHDPAEHRLMAALPDCLGWLEALETADRQDVRTVLRHITQGQSLDLARFADASAPRALANANDLHEYTYLVAGSVGEFWTDLCVRHLPDFATLPPASMRALGREYGMGLQLVNILRDCGSDLAVGRCYLPQNELAAAGLASVESARAHPDLLKPVWDRWHRLASRHLDSGLRYAQAVNSRRLRAASVLPALLGVRTLGLLQGAGTGALRRRVKVPRREVRNILAQLALTLAARRSVAAQFRRLQGQPAAGWDNPAA